MTNPAAVALRHGYDIDTTPIDKLISGSVAMSLEVAEAMADDGDYPDELDQLPGGFTVLEDWEYP